MFFDLIHRLRHQEILLLSFISFFFLFSSTGFAAIPLYDELGRLMNPGEVYEENNPPEKGKEGKPVPEIDQYNHLGVTKLQSAIRFQQLDKARDLLKQGANPDVISARGATALQMAVKNDDMKAVRLLLEYGANPNRVDTLRYAKSEEIREILKEKGAGTSKESPKKTVHMSIDTPDEARVISETIDQVRKYNKPIPTLAQAIILQVDVSHLEKMISEGKDVNEVDPLFGTALYQFFRQKYKGPDIALFLLDKGANPNLAFSMDYSHPFRMAIRRGDLSIVKKMIEKGADLSLKNDEGQSLLSMVADGGSVQLAELLLKQGADVNAQDKDGKTPLYYVLWRNAKNIDMARLLLEHGASTRVVFQKVPIEALWVLRWHDNNIPLALLLLEYKAKPVVNREKETLVHWAVKAKSQLLLEAAIKAGVDVKERNRDGDSALMIAVAKKNPEMVQVLLDAGAPVNASVHTPFQMFVDSYGKVHPGTDDLLAIAVKSGDLEVINILVKAGVNLNTTANSFEKPTPLHIAVTKKRLDIADVLLSAGASPNSRDRYKRTPLHLVGRYGDVAMAKRLLAAGAKINAVDEEGHTPLDMADRNSEKEITELLQKAGAKKGTPVKNDHG